jgi:hypothetical protein
MQAKKTDYTFILGLSHCGSTLLTFLLNAHPEIATVGEIERLRAFIPDRWARKKDACSCGRSFYECPVWNRILAGFAARGHGFNDVDYFAYNTEQKPEADAKLKAFTDAVLEVSEKRVFLDASKKAGIVKSIFDNPYLNVKVINLYRDGRGVVNSWLKHEKRGASRRMHSTGTRGDNHRRPVDVFRTIWRWRRLEMERQSVLAAIPADRVLSVKYEDLATASQKTLREIFVFLQVDPRVDVVPDFKSAVEHHVIGNPMRLDEWEEIVPDTSWRTEMQAGSLLLFRLLGGERLNRMAGYAVK